MTDFADPLQTPLPKNSAVNRLIEAAPFERVNETDALFMQAMREAARHHIKHCAIFRNLWENEGFTPEMLKTHADLEKMPFIFVAAFKQRHITSTKDEDVALELTSSGTTGQKSRIVLDRTSLDRVRRIAWQCFNGLGMTDPEQEADCLCFTYDPAAAKNLGTAFTDKLLTGLTKRGEIFYAIRWDDKKQSFYFDLDGAAEALSRFEKRGRQTRIIGFPAHALALCELYKKRFGRDARLNPSSWVITGGGWKDQQDRAVDKQQMRALIAKSLGLETAKVRDMFGMVEHGVPYIDCPHGEFHIPVYGRVLVRHPATLEPLEFGQTGLLQFITPYLTSYPSISLLTSDFGTVLPQCSCGMKSPVMRVLGRAGVTKMKGCAIAASALL